jgi:hypothetical protein
MDIADDGRLDPGEETMAIKEMPTEKLCSELDAAIARLQAERQCELKKSPA